MIWIKGQRKDNKYNVTVGFDSGKRIKRILYGFEIQENFIDKGCEVMAWGAYRATDSWRPMNND